MILVELLNEMFGNETIYVECFDNNKRSLGNTKAKFDFPRSSVLYIQGTPTRIRIDPFAKQNMKFEDESGLLKVYFVSKDAEDFLLQTKFVRLYLFGFNQPITPALVLKYQLKR